MFFEKLKSSIKHQIIVRGERSRSFDPNQPLIVAGTFKTSNGIGRAAVGCYQALRALGLDPIAVDLSEGFNQVDQDSPITLSQPQISRYGTAIIYANPPELERALMILGLRRWHAWRVIGAWVWELPSAPEAWQKQVDLVSEIWAPSSFVTTAFSRDFSVPVKRVPHYFELPEKTAKNQASPIDAENPFKVVVLADGRSSFHRKNIAASIEIFKLAFEKGAAAELTIKSRNLPRYPEIATLLNEAVNADDRISVLDTSMPHEALMSLIADHHVLLSPHRSEGFGISLAEAMMLGTIAVATGWSGNTDFMDAENSILLPYTLREVIDPTDTYETSSDVWATINCTESANALRRLSDDCEHRAKIAARGKSDTKKFVSIEPYRDALGVADVLSIN